MVSNQLVSKLKRYISTTLTLLLPFLIILTYCLLIAETYTYIGALKRYVYFDSRFFLGFTLLATIYLMIFGNKNIFKTKYLEIALTLNTLATPPIIFFYYYFIMAESLHYPNFVFSTYHFQPQNIIYLIYFNVALLTFSFLRSYYLKLTKSLINGFLSHSQRATLAIALITCYFLGYYFIQNISASLTKMASNAVFIEQHPHLSDDEKMAASWGRLYRYFLLVKQHTPEDAIIGLPPAQNHWLSSGNTVLVRYFLYPRNVINLKETKSLDTLSQLPPGKLDYLLLATGEWADDTSRIGWPKIPIESSKIWYFDLDTGTATTSAQNFDPDLPINQTSWGLIQLAN